MLGHKVLRTLAHTHECVGTVRAPQLSQATAEALEGAQVETGVDCRDLYVVETLIRRVKPDVVLNCVGIVKQRPEAGDPIASIQVNALLPHSLVS